MTSHRSEHSIHRNFANYSKRRKLARKNSNQQMKSQHFSARRKFATNQLKSRKIDFAGRKNPRIESHDKLKFTSPYSNFIPISPKNDEILEKFIFLKLWSTKK